MHSKDSALPSPFFSIIGRQVPEECLDVSEVYGTIHYNNDNTQRLTSPGSRANGGGGMDQREEHQEIWSSWKNLNRSRYRGWKQGKLYWEKYRKMLETARELHRKAKALADVNLAKDIKSNKKRFFRYIIDKRQHLVEQFQKRPLS